MDTLHVRLDFTVSKSPLVPFNSTICPRNGPKRRQKAPKFAQCAPTPRNQARAVSWATWLKIRFRGHLVHSQPPTFCGFHPSESPKRTPRPPYHWSLGAAGGQPSPRIVGANGWSTRVPRAKKIIFSKVVPGPLGKLKQVFLVRFKPMVARFGPWKIPKCLENGPFWDQKWVKAMDAEKTGALRAQGAPNTPEASENAFNDLAGIAATCSLAEAVLSVADEGDPGLNIKRATVALALFEDELCNAPDNALHSSKKQC